ncbi:MAG TPA: TolC family protein [Vicinamibacterales bacterium]|jgi:cobalt-zinc-cadmium efflux system outer membrane protein
MILGAAVILASVPVAAQTTAQPSTQPPLVRVTLDQAIDLARQHNHALLAARTTIQQNQAQETTANLRPNPVLLGDAQFLPLFDWSNFTSDYFDNSAQFDVGVSYLFERGKKRQHRLQAAQDQTAVTTAQVGDTERTLTFNVSSQFIAVLLAQAELDLAEKDLASFQQSVEISQAKFNAGGLSEGDLLKIKLQLLQFQVDVSSFTLARVQALASLRQLIGYELVAESYTVEGALVYQPLRLAKPDLQALAITLRPDLSAARLGVTAAQSQLSLAQANGKRDVTAQFSVSHVAATTTGAFFANIEIPLFDKNQGEIARTRFAITQSQELRSEQTTIVLTDVTNAYEALHTSGEIVRLYESGYMKQAEDSRDISQYAYQRGGTTLLDFLDAERSYRATSLAYLQSLASYMVALETLHQAVGTRSLP